MGSDVAGSRPEVTRYCSTDSDVAVSSPEVSGFRFCRLGCDRKWSHIVPPVKGVTVKDQILSLFIECTEVN